MFNIIDIVQKQLEKSQKLRKKFEIEKNKIERERLILNGDGIFLADEFLAVAARPLAQQDKKFTQSYGVKAEMIGKWFDSSEYLDIYSIPFDLISQRMKKYAEQSFEKEVQDVAQARMDAEGEDCSWHWNADKLSGVDEFKKKYIDALKDNTVFPAFRMGELGELLTIAGFLKYEDKAIKSGQAKAVLDFWKAMNTMDDYSHLFKNGGGGGRNEEEKEPIVRQLDKFRPAF